MTQQWQPGWETFTLSSLVGTCHRLSIVDTNRFITLSTGVTATTNAGGSVSIDSGSGKATSFGAVAMKSANGGVDSSSGSIAVETGSTNSGVGDSISLSVGSGHSGT